MTIALHELIEQLEAEGVLDPSTQSAAASYMESRSIAQPWYVRAMVGIGAWLASLLLIGFIGGFAFALESGYAFVGIAFIAAAIFVRRQNDNDFLVQSSLAVSLAGQALFSWGFAEMSGAEESEAWCALIIVMSTVLFFIFPDRVHRVIMVLLVAGSLTVLLYLWELNALVPLIGPMLAGGLIVVHAKQGKFIASGQGEYLRPLMSGLMLSAFAVLMLSTIYIMPDLPTGDTEIYPRPWITTIALGALFLWVGAGIWPNLTVASAWLATSVIYALMLIVILSSYAAPGLLLALIVVMLGAASSQRTFTGAGVGFLAVFVGAYFYAIEVTMLTKSITLVATGIAVFLTRWVLLAFISTESPREERRA